MRSASVIVFAIVLAFAATAAFAEAACPTLTPCPSATIPSQTGPCGCLSAPAGIGAGPLPCLQGQCGADFDRAFITSMYQQSSDIAALATQGIQQSTSGDLKDLSGKIRYEQTKQNEKYALWAQQAGYGTLSVDYGRVESVVSPLAGLTGQAFNVEYANRMVALLGQQRDAAQMALTSSTDPRVRDQAGIIVRATTNEINALQRWLGNAMAPAAAGFGAGPALCPGACPTAVPTCPSPCAVPAAPAAGPCCPSAAPACAPVCPGASGAGPVVIQPGMGTEAGSGIAPIVPAPTY